MPPAGMPQIPPQRWQCAVCVSGRRAWEAAHHDEIKAAVAEAAARGAPHMAARLLPPELFKTMPPVMEAVTLATLPGAGTAAVCAGHCPVIGDGSRRPLLVAAAGMSMNGQGL